MPVPQGQLPQIGRQYSQLLQEVTTQARIIEFIRPIYEQASFDEQRQVAAVQVLDVARVPKLKAGPRRSVLVIAVSLTSLVVAMVLVLTFAFVKRNFAYMKYKLKISS